MRASRLLTLLILLQMRGKLPAEALARELEVSVRTVYRDIDELSAAGVPIYAEQGRNGGIALHDGYRTRLTGLSTAEAEALSLAGLGQAAAALGMGEDAATARLKMMAALPPASGEGARRIAERFYLDPAPWYHRAEAVAELPALAQAVWRDRRIRLRYESWSEVVTREIDPLGLAVKGGLWYLVGAMGGSVRTYRVSSIQKLEILDETARRPAYFNLAAYWNEWAGAFEARLLGARARVRLSPEGRRILRATSSLAADHVEATARLYGPDGWVEAELPFETPDYSARQLLRLGAEVEVLEPQALREAVRNEARRVADIYR